MRQFDKYDTIEYHNTTKLFWKEYPYKVVVRGRPSKEVVPTYCRIPALDQRTAYEDSLVAYAPRESSLWRMMDTGTYFNFFFRDESATLEFIDKAQADIIEVFRPHSSQILRIMQANSAVKARDTFYWGRYPWCITFAPMNLDQENDLLEWYQIYFGNPFDDRYLQRSYFSLGCVNRLYLRDERDVIFIKLGKHHLIRSITQAVIQGKENGTQSCENVD